MSRNVQQGNGSTLPDAHDPSLSWIDTHCHLEMKDFDPDRDQVVQRAREGGCVALVTVASDPASNARGVELAEARDIIFSTVGVHPHDAKDYTEDIHLRLRQWAAHPKVVAIGETGLDYHYDHSPRDAQRRVFGRQLELARETGLPVVVHSREARQDTMAILKESGNSRGVLHCFSGDRSMAEEAMGMGFYISVAGPVTFRKSVQLKEIARIIPDDYLLLETDAPYLTPEPFRGKRNEPAHLLHTLAEVSRLRGVSEEDLARITVLNARRLFGIGTLPNRAEIAYRIRDSLYLNITNRCTNACSFCIRFRSDFVKGHNLRLSREPSAAEVMREIGDPRVYDEVVFCGYGEPLQRFDLVRDVSRWIKENGGRVRINTNGHAAIIHGRNILPELEGLVDSVSVSLDAQDAATYERICKPAFPNAFDAVLGFIREARRYIPDVQVTVVEMEGVDVARCREIAAGLGVPLRVRKLDVVG